jgi:hypothetical protein
MAQMYKLGNYWLDLMNWTVSFGSKEAGQALPAAHTSKEEYELFHESGPLLMVVVHDMVRIVDTWTKIAPPMLELNLGFISEMFAYVAAAAHNNLPHRMVRSLMFSQVGNDLEAWELLFNLTRIDNVPLSQMLYVLQYCQQYYLGPFFFNKRTLSTGSDNILSCNHPMLAELPAPITEYTYSMAASGQVYNHTWEERLSRGFYLYHLTRKVNQAIEHYKCINCENGNYKKMYMLTCWIHGGVSIPTKDTVCDYKVLCYLYIWSWPLTYMDNCTSE